MLEWVAIINGNFSCSSGALIACQHCVHDQRFWVGWDRCPCCGKKT